MRNETAEIPHRDFAKAEFKVPTSLNISFFHHEIFIYFFFVISSQSQCNYSIKSDDDK